jgi:hypothetical protein
MHIANADQTVMYNQKSYPSTLHCTSTLLRSPNTMPNPTQRGIHRGQKETKVREWGKGQYSYATIRDHVPVSQCDAHDNVSAPAHVYGYRLGRLM